ncbi:MATE family efflux transporter [Propionicimonas sp.]|uniref:MATE family efflux transporter n=1 Tax=Propionicimonas sp. TaxID=1955623 RepID=UPI0039E5C904
MTKNLTIGPPVRQIVVFTVPLLVGNVFQQLYAVTDAIVVGRMLGVDALAAVGASGSLQFLLFGFAIGASAGLAIPVARAYGAGDLPAMRRSVAAGALISLAVAAAIVAIGTIGAHPLLVLMGTPPELLGDATTFLTVLFSGAAATVAFNFLSAIIRALGDSRTPLIFLVVACVLNATLVVVFIAGLHLGIGGAAAATIVAQATSVVLCLVLIARRMPELRLRSRDWRVQRSNLSESAGTGLTMGFQMSVIAIGAVVLQYGINTLGADAVAAFTAAMRVDQVAVAPLASVGVAMTTYVAQNRGAGQWWRIRVGVFRISIVAAGLALVLGVVIWLAGTRIVELFVGPGQDRVVGMAHQYLIVNSALYAVLAMVFLLRNTIQGLGATTVPTIAGFAELGVRSLVGLFLVERIGFLGACLAAPLAWVGALLPIAIAWFLERRRLLRYDAAGLPARGCPSAPLEAAPAQ